MALAPDSVVCTFRVGVGVFPTGVRFALIEFEREGVTVRCGPSSRETSTDARRDPLAVAVSTPEPLLMGLGVPRALTEPGLDVLGVVLFTVYFRLDVRASSAVRETRLAMRATAAMFPTCFVFVSFGGMLSFCRVTLLVSLLLTSVFSV